MSEPGSLAEYVEIGGDVTENLLESRGFQKQGTQWVRGDVQMWWRDGAWMMALGQQMVSYCIWRVKDLNKALKEVEAKRERRARRLATIELGSPS